MTAPFTAFPIPTAPFEQAKFLTGGATTSRSEVQRWGDRINVLDFGAKGDDFTDCTAPIQAAIDYAFAHGFGSVYIPPGIYRVTGTIWLDPPNGMRTTGTSSPTVFNFSMALVGDENLGSDLPYGTEIRADDGSFGYANYPVLVVGPGQGMRVAGLMIRSEGGSLWNITFPNTGIGIAISGGAGGASRTLVERCMIMNLYTGIKTGWNSDALADSNTFFKVFVNAARYGWYFSQTQNYINELISCGAAVCTYAVYSPVGKAVNIYGGNYSFAGAANTDQSFTISGTTTPDAFTGQFSTTMTFPGSLGPPFSKNAFTDSLIGEPLYTAYAVETLHFGVIPLVFVSFNSVSNLITLKFDPSWVTGYFGNVGIDFSTTDIQAEIQACTTLYCCQRFIPFLGQGIHVYGAHTENPNTVTCLVKADSGFDGDSKCTVENIYLNYDPGQPGGPFQDRVQQVFPFAEAVTAAIEFSGSWGGYTALNTNRPILVSGTSTLAANFNHQEVRVFSPNLRYHSFFEFPAVNDPYSRGLGCGKFSCMSFFPHNSNPGHGFDWLQSRGNFHTYGVSPAPGAMPELLPSQFTDMQVGPPVVAALGSYPPAFGGVAYRVFQWDTNVTGGKLFALSNHEFYSYGQNLSVNWTYKGQSNILYVNSTDWLFNGLKIGLNNGSGTKWYVITGVFPTSGYVSVQGVTNSFTLLDGTKTVVYTGSTIFQESYSWTQY